MLVSGGVGTQRDGLRAPGTIPTLARAGRTAPVVEDGIVLLDKTGWMHPPDAPGPDRRRWRPDPWLLAVVGVVAAAGATYVALDEEMEPPVRACTADGHVDPRYDHRDPDQDCLWVDEDGNVVPDQ